MLPTLILVGLASLHTPAPSFANYVFTIPVRIESMTHITTANVSCTLTHTTPTTVPTSVGSAQTPVPVVGGNFTGNIVVTVAAADSRVAAYPPTGYSCVLAYSWRNPDGTIYSASHLVGAREGVYTRMTGQEISTATIEAAGTIPPG